MNRSLLIAVILSFCFHSVVSKTFQKEFFSFDDFSFIDGINFRFVDTAGIRKEQASIESISVDMAMSEIQKKVRWLYM